MINGNPINDIYGKYFQIIKIYSGVSSVIGFHKSACLIAVNDIKDDTTGIKKYGSILNMEFIHKIELFSVSNSYTEGFNNSSQIPKNHPI